MKTTLDLPDDLLIEVQALAAKQRTTLNAMIEHALRRELKEQSEKKPFTSEIIDQIQRDLEEQELHEAIKMRKGKKC